MGYHKCHIPDLDVLKIQFDKLGLKSFVEKYKKCEALIGDSISIQFIESKIKLWYELQKRN